MSILHGLIAAVLGVGAFAFANPAGVPAFRLAFAAAGFLRESCAGKRLTIFALLGAGSLICSVGILRSSRLSDDSST